MMGMTYRERRIVRDELRGMKRAVGGGRVIKAERKTCTMSLESNNTNIFEFRRNLQISPVDQQSVFSSLEWENSARTLRAGKIRILTKLDGGGHLRLKTHDTMSKQLYRGHHEVRL